MQLSGKVRQKIDTGLKISPADVGGACYGLKMKPNVI